MCTTKVCHPSILQMRGCHLCDPSYSGMGGMHQCHLDPLTETSRGGPSPMSPSIQKCYPRALQGLHRRLLRRGLHPPPPSESLGPCHKAPPLHQTPQTEDVHPLPHRAEGP